MGSTTPKADQSDDAQQQNPPAAQVDQDDEPDEWYVVVFMSHLLNFSQHPDRSFPIEPKRQMKTLTLGVGINGSLALGVLVCLTAQHKILVFVTERRYDSREHEIDGLLLREEGLEAL